MPAKDLQVKDWEAAHAAAQRTYFPHHLRPLGRWEPDFRLVAVDLGPVLIGRIGWGADVSIDCEYPDAIEVNAPLAGVLQSEVGRQRIASTRGSATVFASGQSHPITRWSNDCEVLGVKLDAQWLTAQAQAGFGVTGRLTLPHQLDLRGIRLAEWWRLVRSLHMAGVSDPIVAQPLASAVATSFLLAVLPDEAHAPVPAGVVRRVVDAMGDDPQRSWTAVEMAQVAGVSVRRLQETFAADRGRTPRQVLIDLRLDRARSDLRQGDRTVSEVAAEWGFSNSGRFAAAYRDRFGRLPSEEQRYRGADRSIGHSGNHGAATGHGQGV